jgi:hypothetical protein
MSEATSLTAYREPRAGSNMPRGRATVPPVFGAGPADLGDPVNRAVTDWARRASAPRAVWRAWWHPAGSAGAPRRVYVVETERGADPAVVRAAVRGALATAGEADPRAEVYALGGPVSGFQLQARSNGLLLWARRADPGVRRANVHDGQNFDGDHPRLAEAEAERVLRYLKAGRPVLGGLAPAPDVMDPGRPAVVPAGHATDGAWVWSEATAYYLRLYRLAPDPALLEHIRALDYAAPEVDGSGLHRALAVLRAPRLNTAGPRAVVPD